MTIFIYHNKNNKTAMILDVFSFKKLLLKFKEKKLI